MDGTLLPFGSRVISERTHQAILSALAARIWFGPASGRDYVDLADAFDGDTRCFSTGIMANGKKVFSSGELVFKKTLSTEALVKLEGAVRPYAGTSLWLVADADETGMRCEQFLCGVEPDDEFALGVVEDSGRDMTPGDVPTNRDVITAGIFVNVDAAPTEVVRSQCKGACPELDFPAPAPFFLDVVPAGWSKVNGLDALLGSLEDNARRGRLYRRLGKRRDAPRKGAALLRSRGRDAGGQGGRALPDWRRRRRLRRAAHRANRTGAELGFRRRG